jgi:hypothetical protein
MRRRVSLFVGVTPDIKVYTTHTHYKMRKKNQSHDLPLQWLQAVQSERQSRHHVANSTKLDTNFTQSL